MNAGRLRLSESQYFRRLWLWLTVIATAALTIGIFAWGTYGLLVSSIRYAKQAAHTPPGHTFGEDIFPSTARTTRLRLVFGQSNPHPLYQVISTRCACDPLTAAAECAKVR